MSRRQPVLFIGHGSPMNAIAKNAYTGMLARLGREVDREIGRPRAILCISAHWMTEGTWITHQSAPRTIHDFYGFPPELFAVKYPAQGSPEIAEEIIRGIPEPRLVPDDEQWGYDHGTWAVLRHLYPNAEVPVLQLSLHMEQPASYHYALGEKLRALRENGVLIVASGNIVHNLRRIVWEENAPAYPWAIEFDTHVRDAILRREHQNLILDELPTEAGRQSVPTPDHYYPLLYTLGASDAKDTIRFEYDGIENGSISMRTVSFGLAG